MTTQSLSGYNGNVVIGYQNSSTSNVTLDETENISTVFIPVLVTEAAQPGDFIVARLVIRFLSNGSEAGATITVAAREQAGDVGRRTILRAYRGAANWMGNLSGSDEILSLEGNQIAAFTGPQSYGIGWVVTNTSTGSAGSLILADGFAELTHYRPLVAFPGTASQFATRGDNWRVENTS